MKMNVLSKLGGIALILSTALFMTACGNADNALEEIINGGSGSGSGEGGGSTTITIPDVTGFAVCTLEDIELTGDITAFTVTDQAGNAITCTKTDDKYTIEKANINPSTVKELWLEATVGNRKYIANAKVEDLQAIATAGKLKMATVGDLYNSDGTFSAAQDASKTHIGVIGYIGMDNFTENGTSVNGSAFVGHGLVLCLKDAATGVDAQWSTQTTALEFEAAACVNSDADLKRTTYVSGYSNTKKLAEKANAETDYKAAYKVWNYTTLPAPTTGTTGWFLPSAQQWVKIVEALGGIDGTTNMWNEFDGGDSGFTVPTKFDDALSKAGTGKYDSMKSKQQYYYSSSELDTEHPEGCTALCIGLSYSNGTQFYGVIKNPTDVNNSPFHARPFLAF